MITAILGLIDLLGGSLFLISIFSNSINQILLATGLAVLIKGLLFIKSLDVASILDVVAGGIILISLIVEIVFLVKIIVSVFLLQKAFFSFINLMR